MKVRAIKTHKITRHDSDIFKVLNLYIKDLKEKSIVVVTSKIVSICEGRIIKKISDTQKDELVKKEAEYYLPKKYNQYGFLISIKHNILVASAGIDESNGNGYLVLWPKNIQNSANTIRAYLTKKFHLKSLGVIISDSKLTPLRWGVTGVSVAHSGFQAIYSYIGKPDIFGRRLRAEKSNIADALATAAVVVMGEGNEQQPLAIIEDIDFVKFQTHNPSQKELNSTRISLTDDVYSRLLTSVKWKSGQGRA